MVETIREHSLYFRIVTAEVAFMVTSIGSLEGIYTNINGAFASRSTWHFNHQDGITAVSFDTDVMLLKNIGTDFLCIVNRHPEITP